MSNAVSSILSNADYFILVIFRAGALLVTSPIFGRVNIPGRVKVGFAVVLGYLFFVACPPVAPIEYSSVLGLLLVVAGEILIGVALGFVTNVFFSLTFVAGQLIDMQIGFGIVNVYDAQNNTQIPMVGNILNIVMLLVFFAVDGHQRLIQMVYYTLQVLPVGHLNFDPQAMGWVALRVFSDAFLMGVMVAMPVVASGVILELSLGMLIRTVPQMNMFVVGIPLKLLIGFVILFFTLPMFTNFTDRIFSELFAGIDSMFQTLQPAAG